MNKKAQKVVEVILKRGVKGVGKLGDTAGVRPGYARYLIKSDHAWLATKTALEEMQKQRESLAQLEKERQIDAQKLADTIKSSTLTFRRKTVGQGKLYGSVNIAEIHEEIKNSLNITIAKDAIYIPTQIKEVGVHTITLHISDAVSCELNIAVEELV